MTSVRVGGFSTARSAGTIKQIGTYAGTFNPNSGLPTSGTGRGGSILKGDYWKASAAGVITDLEPHSGLSIGDIIYASVNNADAVGEFFSAKVNQEPRIVSTASTSTLTVNVDSYDQANVTALASALTIANPTGTPVDGQGLLIRIEDNGTSRALTFGAQFRAFGSALPTATTLGKIMYIGAIWNALDSKWDTRYTEEV